MKQNLYVEFHNALMGFSGRLNEQTILSIAEQSGLNVDQLKQDMTDPQIKPPLIAICNSRASLGRQRHPTTLSLAMKLCAERLISINSSNRLPQREARRSKGLFAFYIKPTDWMSPAPAAAHRYKTDLTQLANY
ncbi:MAG: hypothetical protein R3F37_07295 [Candidatus Competibacteraceae bacterium]